MISLATMAGQALQASKKKAVKKLVPDKNLLVA